MTPEEERLRDAFLAECWRSVPEVPKHFRDEKRKADRAVQRRLEEMAFEAVHNPSTTGDDLPTPSSTGCAQNGQSNLPEVPTDCVADVAESVCRQKESTPGRGGCNTNAPRGLAS